MFPLVAGRFLAAGALLSASYLDLRYPHVPYSTWPAPQIARRDGKTMVLEIFETCPILRQTKLTWIYNLMDPTEWKENRANVILSLRP